VRPTTGAFFVFVSAAAAACGEGRSIRANVGVELKGVSWELKGVEGGD
jgi:hypothetical protein